MGMSKAKGQRLLCGSGVGMSMLPEEGDTDWMILGVGEPANAETAENDTKTERIKRFFIGRFRILMASTNTRDCKVLGDLPANRRTQERFPATERGVLIVLGNIECQTGL